MKKLHTIRLSIVTFLLPVITFAQVGIENPLKSNPHSVQDIFDLVMPKVNAVGAIIATLSFVYNGFLFAKAKGNPKEIETAKAYFTGTVIGVLIILGANIIVAIVNATIDSLS